MTLEDKFIISCKSWNEFWTQTKSPSLTRIEKGKRFERLTQLYLQALPTYQSKLSDVWLLSEVPTKVLHQIGLPKPDEGIDLIAKTRNGEYWAIQSKFTSDKDTALNRKKIGTFISLAFNTCKKISWAVLAHTSDKPISKHRLLKKTFEIGLDAWRQLDDELSRGETGWDLIKQRINRPAVKPRPLAPRSHQIKAIADAKKHYLTDKQTRGRMIMPCGTGKSLTAYWIARALKAQTVIIAVPSLALIRQSLDDWTREFAANDIIPEWGCICSDDSVGDLDKDSFVSDIYETGIPTYSDINEISAFLRRPTKAPKIIFTTYQSSDKLSVAAKRTKIEIDLAILDEAHKTVGHKSSVFSTLLYDKNIKVNKRLFMTATERVLRGQNDDIVSMNDDATIYGERFHQLTFKEAIKLKLITDYKIVTQIVSEARIREIVEENRLLNIDSKNMTDIEAQTLAAGIAIKDLFKNENLKHAISFHRSIEAAKNFSDQQEKLNSYIKLKPKIDTFHISSKKSAGEREKLLDDFKTNPCALISNARCLTEGIDVPAIDCVLFADPKKSTIDIVQATGRALRKYTGKKFGYVVVPLIVPGGMGFSEFAETTPFRHVSEVITALSTQDERIVEEFRAITVGKKYKGKIINIQGNVPVGLRMQLSEFSDAVRAHIWPDVGRANWRPFEEAREFAHTLKLKSASEWFKYSKTGDRPRDIPSGPEKTYAITGEWRGWGDWLGTGNIHPSKIIWKSFKDARQYARSLKLKTTVEWRRLAKTGKIPADIPSSPVHLYRNSGWVSWSDWLGTEIRRVGGWLDFDQARKWARSKNLNSSKAWNQSVKNSFPDGTTKPFNIPASPQRVYANDWVSWSDWLGNSNKFVSPHLGWREFKSARSYVKTLKLNSGREWVLWARSDNRPSDIPISPKQAYGSEWQGMGDWLGTERKRPGLQEYLPYEEANQLVRQLALGSISEWELACKENKLPINIPKTPNRAYAGIGWIDWSHWLGCRVTQKKGWRPFEEARKFSISTGIKKRSEWNAWFVGKLERPHPPSDIPSNPEQAYPSEWRGWRHWIGDEENPTIKPKRVLFRGNWRSFIGARQHARSLRLNNTNEWRNYAKGLMPSIGAKPNDIPANPWRVYAKDGWLSINDWLGITGTKPKHIAWEKFGEARKYVHQLNLKSSDQWRAYCRGDFRKLPAKPLNIPANPNTVYKKLGWNGMGDWLGTGIKATRKTFNLPFHDGRNLARTLHLQNRDQYQIFVRNHNTDKNFHGLPLKPERVYKEYGWAGWSDWLNTSNKRGNWRPFVDARSYARKLKLKNITEWMKFCKSIKQSMKKPQDIPTNPAKVYVNDGWAGWGDWLGNKNIAPINMTFMPFKKARNQVRKLGLKSQKQWQMYSNSGNRLAGVPTHPERYYQYDGWISWPDWLGVNNK